ncbi:ABC transporter substrate-binding protein, partial [Limosilactobacillus reuteri]
IIAVLGAAAGVGITGLRGGNSGLNAVVGSLRGGRKLEVGLLDEPTSLDIRSNSERSVQQALMGNVYETLVTFNDEQAIASGLAARWTQTTDGLRYTFFLRNGLTFSDGTPLDASSVVRSLQQTLAGDHTNDGLSNITAVENNDARSVTFTLSSPNPRLLPALASQAGAIVNPNAKNPDFAHHSYGSGPFIVNAVQPGSIELTRNEHYWADKPKTSQATLRYYTDEQKMADDLKAGKLN